MNTWVTSVVAVVSLLLAGQAAVWTIPAGEADLRLRGFGAAVAIPLTVPGEVAFPDLVPAGLQDLWRGEVWRVVVTTFQHGDLPHLLVNLCGWLLLGVLVEKRIGSIGLLCLLPAAVIIPTACELLTGHGVVGLSGVICTLFGLMLGLAEIEPEHPETLSFQWRMLGIVALGVSLLGSLFELDRGAVVAHLTGLVYGWFYACTVYGQFRLRVAIRSCFAGAHLLLLPLLWLVVNPLWRPEFVWWQARHSQQPLQARTLLTRATYLGPHFLPAWHDLVQSWLDQGEFLQAWRTSLDGLLANPYEPVQWEVARHCWQQVVLTPDRAIALEYLSESLGPEAATWERQIRSPLVAPPWLPEPVLQRDPNEQRDAAALRWSQPVDLLLPGFHLSRPPAPRPADDPAQAQEGVPL